MSRAADPGMSSLGSAPASNAAAFRQTNAANATVKRLVHMSATWLQDLKILQRVPIIVVRTPNV